ncbi:MAG: hypothetical protein SGJ09_02895 [Phycisphaerae bacterium]|nr:hypothetical protein [Phycisphaerae bacterium]
MHVTMLAFLNNLGLLLLARQKPADAEVTLRKMAAGVESMMPGGHWMRGQASVKLARSLIGQAKDTEAEPARDFRLRAAREGSAP